MPSAAAEPSLAKAVIAVNCGTHKKAGMFLGRNAMKFSAFFAMFMILLLLWAGGFLVYHIASALIHVLLVLAVVFLLIHLVRGAARKG
jgi:hypothetical protein